MAVCLDIVIFISVAVRHSSRHTVSVEPFSFIPQQHSTPLDLSVHNCISPLVRSCLPRYLRHVRQLRVRVEHGGGGISGADPKFLITLRGVVNYTSPPSVFLSFPFRSLPSSALHVQLLLSLNMAAKTGSGAFLVQLSICIQCVM